MATPFIAPMSSLFKMIPAEGWVSDAMRDEKWAKGYFATTRAIA